MFIPSKRGINSGGRSVQADPIGIAGGLNVYSYTSNPVGEIDPMGLARCTCTKRGELVAKGSSVPITDTEAAARNKANSRAMANVGHAWGVASFLFPTINLYKAFSFLGAVAVTEAGIRNMQFKSGDFMTYERYATEDGKGFIQVTNFYDKDGNLKTSSETSVCRD